MATDVRDIGDTIATALGRIAREATHSVSGNGHRGVLGKSDGGPLSGMRGVVAGAALAAAAPIAARGAGRAVRSAVAKRAGALDGGALAGKAADAVKDTVGDAVGKATDAPSVVKEAGKQMLPGGDGDGGGANAGTGKGRRMPVQQAVDVGVPLQTVYDQWTQFEQWPEFMHRVVQVTQEDDCTVSFKVKVWGMSKEFVAEIEEQRPDERIEWRATEGVTHTGVVTFHELAPRLTRVQVTLDVDPGSLVEKAARGMRHVKRAVRGDLARFKAFVELEDEESGAWRGTIHEGRVVERGRPSQGEERRQARRPSRRSPRRSRSRATHERRSGGARRRSGASRRRS